MPSRSLVWRAGPGSAPEARLQKAFPDRDGFGPKSTESWDVFADMNVSSEDALISYDLRKVVWNYGVPEAKHFPGFKPNHVKFLSIESLGTSIVRRKAWELSLGFIHQCFSESVAKSPNGL